MQQPQPAPTHPQVRRVELHQVRAEVAALRQRGYAELSQLRGPGHLAELRRAEDGAEVSICHGYGGDILLFADRDWAQIARWEA